MNPLSESNFLDEFGERSKELESFRREGRLLRTDSRVGTGNGPNFRHAARGGVARILLRRDFPGYRFDAGVSG